MSFFTDPTIASLTSGYPSQSVDLGGFSFPRRMGVRFHPDFIKKYRYVGLQCRWSAYADKVFTQRLGKEFDHKDTVSREGWARYFFDGKFEKDRAYIKLELVNADTGALVHTYFFEFQKRYQTSLDGQTYMLDPVLKTKIVRDGALHELFPDKDGRYKAMSTCFMREVLQPVPPEDSDSGFLKVKERIPAITQSYAKYSEKPKILFMVTPPHLMKYAKLLLIIIKQLCDLNFDRAYMTKENQKPLYKTRYMLDELGNLQSEGHGISGLETMLSIGLGQDQQFTLILQTLQQLKDVYGDSVDKVVQGNTSNIVFLKSTDDDMIRTLEGMSGKTHVAMINGKTVTKDIERLVLSNEGKVGYNVTVQELPVISYNDMAFIPERNSIVFRAGSSPIWNRNETILPMSWRLFKNTIEMPGKKFSLQTIPTMSNVLDFDLKNNQPDFDLMLRQRMEEAYMVDSVRADYMEAFGYTDADVARMDIDVYAEDVMRLMRDTIRANKALEDRYADEGDMEGAYNLDDVMASAVPNTEQLEVNRQNAENQSALERKRYAGGRLSREQVLDPTDSVSMAILIAYAKTYQYFGRLGRGIRLDGEKGRCLFCGDDELVHFSMDQYQALKDAAKEADSKIYDAGEAIGQADELFGGYTVHQGFYKFLTGMPNWASIAGGAFDRAVAEELDRSEAAADDEAISSFGED